MSSTSFVAVLGLFILLYASTAPAQSVQHLDAVERDDAARTIAEGRAGGSLDLSRVHVVRLRVDETVVDVTSLQPTWLAGPDELGTLLAIDPEAGRLRVATLGRDAAFARALPLDELAEGARIQGPVWQDAELAEREIEVLLHVVE
jgi:hypothetical protein